MTTEPHNDKRLQLLEHPSDDDDAIDFLPIKARDEALVAVELSDLLDGIAEIDTVNELVKRTSKAVELWRDLDRKYANSSWSALMREPVNRLLTFAKAMEIADASLIESAPLLEEKGGPDSRSFLAHVAEAHYHCKPMKEDFGKSVVLRDCLQEIKELCEQISSDSCAQKLGSSISGWEKVLQTWKFSWKDVPDNALRIIQMYDLLKRLEPRNIALQTHRQVVESLRIYLHVRTRTLETIKVGPITDSRIAQIKRGQRKLKKAAGLPSDLHPTIEPDKRPWEAFFSRVRIQIHNSLQELLHKQKSS
ncbi:MAG: hypothetical protein HOO67_01620 [Candidatus Peribacteraceae bacterium]|nr:hypothetical protein [Candidatus Peribacteraceae bacterium]